MSIFVNNIGVCRAAMWKKLDDRINGEKSPTRTSFGNRFLAAGAMAAELSVFRELHLVSAFAKNSLRAINPPVKSKHTLDADGCYTLNNKKVHKSRTRSRVGYVGKAITTFTRGALIVPLKLPLGLLLNISISLVATKRITRCCQQASQYDQFRRHHKELPKSDVKDLKAGLKAWAGTLITPFMSIKTSEVSESRFMKTDEDAIAFLKTNTN